MVAPSVAEELRDAIAAQIRGLDTDALLALVGDRVLGLVGEHAAPAKAPRGATEEPRPAPSSPAAKAKPEAPAPKKSKAIVALTVPDTVSRADVGTSSVPSRAPLTPTAEAGATPWLPWPRLADDGVTAIGIDLAGIGPHGGPMMTEIRKLTLARVAGAAFRLLDPDDLVQEVARRILRRNHRLKSAFDPRRASLSVYVTRIAGNAVVDELAKAKRIDQRELLGGARVGGDDDFEEDADLASADPRDPIAALEDVDEALEQGLDLAETLSRGVLTWEGNEPIEQPDPDMLSPLESDADEAAKVARSSEAGDDDEGGSRVPTEPLWARALRQREAEQAREREEQKRPRAAPPERGDVEQALERAAARKQSDAPASPSVAKNESEQRRRRERLAALDAEILAFIESESAAGRYVSSVDLVAMLGEPVRTVRESLVRLAELGAIVARMGKGYRAIASPEAAPLPELAPAPPLEPAPFEPAHVAAEEPDESAPDTVRTAAPAFDEEELALPSEPAATRSIPSPPPVRRSFTAARAHASFLAVDVRRCSYAAPVG